MRRKVVWINGSVYVEFLYIVVRKYRERTSFGWINVNVQQVVMALKVIMLVYILWNSINRYNNCPSADW